MQENTHKIEEQELVAQLKKKDQKAIALLYDNYSAALYGVVLRVVQNEAVAEDTLQEVFVKIWKSIDNYDRSKGRLFTWMLNIARNSAIDVLRSKAYKKSEKVQSIDNTVYAEKNSAVQINIDLIGLREKVGALKPDLKEVIDLVYFGGYTHKEAAEKLELPLGTVKTRIKIAIRELRNLME